LFKKKVEKVAESWRVGVVGRKGETGFVLWSKKELPKVLSLPSEDRECWKGVMPAVPDKER